ncbi:hypothetical protein GCM10025876_04470 [Demequina litorisediminis]|uniref:Circularly permuted ATPgrasp domain-containing protein n=1 Tax=Demequina litorisediminis TaxID=1849022 RepID=A0ABQ6IAY2_9MICO|nr:hypothetical protein GCM10025876_04470 [Demequina litorisediminis]
MPDLTRYYLEEDPILPNVDTWRLEERDAREEVLDRLDELVVKPVDGAGGKGVLIGPKASSADLAAAKERILEDPRGWIAQPVVQALDRANLDRGRARAAPRGPPSLRHQ